MILEGVDYSYAPPSPTGLAAAGKRFVVRYGAVGNPAKFLTAAEVAGLRAAGLEIVANVEETARAFQGTEAGVRHARAGDAFFRALGMPPGWPIYFSVDWDAQAADWPAVDAALRGAASVLGAGRVGVYGGYETIAHCAAAGTASWFWQTYAWSGGRWHPACHLQQYQNGVALAGGTVDLTRAVTAFYGQWGGIMAWNPERGAPPDFTVASPPAATAPTTRAHRWFAERLVAMEPGTKLGGTYADKPGYHNMRANLPADDYSVRAAIDREGPSDKSAGTDWTHPDAQAGDYASMVKYGRRMRAAYDDPADPRLSGWREALGQFDLDAPPEALDFRGRYERVPDDTHRWHWHFSETRKFAEDFWNKWALLTVLLGWTVAEWRQSLEGDDGMADITQERFSELMTEWVRKADIVPWYREDGTAIPVDPADPKKHTVTVLTYLMRTGRLAAQFTPERANQIAGLSAQIAAGEAQDVAEAATLAAVLEALREIRTLLDAAGGDPDVAAVLARLDALPDLLGEAGRQAAEDAARTVLDRVAQASRAEAEAYGTAP